MVLCSPTKGRTYVLPFVSESLKLVSELLETSLSDTHTLWPPTESILWTGIKKGPPRKLKFPEPAVVVAALEEALEVAPKEAVKTE